LASWREQTPVLDIHGKICASRENFKLWQYKLCIIAYEELSPFDWIRSADQIPFRVALIEWLPFSSYYSAEPQAALFDLAKKLFLLGPLGFLIAAGTPDVRSRKRQALAATAGLLVGLVLEAGQIALQSRNPSLTDVLLFGGAAWAGAVVFERYRRIRDSCTSLSSTASHVPPTKPET
jgi:glycopeptide antibiotics resistance protein